MAQYKKILVIIPGGISYTYRVGVGISSKLNQHESWMVYLSPLAKADFMRDFNADGMIINISTGASLEFAEVLKTISVNYSGVRDVRSIPTVRLDDIKIGQMAADYFISLGLKNFVFFGDESTSFASLRCKGFADRLKTCGISEDNYFKLNIEPHHMYSRRYDHYSDLLRQLPKPAGIFVKDDRCGCYLANIARDANIAVPDEIAILGVDDDQMYCNFSKPTLSSIATPARQVGAMAVDMLAGLLDGGQAPKEPVLLPPLGVVARGSTDMLAIDDADLAEAIGFIRDNPAASLSVEDVLARVPLSRSSLERKFQQHFGISPGEEIRRVKIEHVKKLLLNTSKSITEIASDCGYRDVQYLSSAFRRIVGQTPSAFRASLESRK